VLQPGHGFGDEQESAEQYLPREVSFIPFKKKKKKGEQGHKSFKPTFPAFSFA